MIKQVGPTGQFPGGKISQDDEGELAVAIGRLDDVVRVDFGKRVSWIGLSPQEARELAILLIERAAEIEDHD